MSEGDGSKAGKAATSKVVARRRSPALAFLIGVAVVGLLAVLAYLVWPERAETPATPAEAAITDEALGLPAPDADTVRAQVDQALRQAPPDAGGRAETAAASAQAQTAPEREDLQSQAAPQPEVRPDSTPSETPEGAAPVAPPEAQ